MVFCSSTPVTKINKTSSPLNLSRAKCAMSLISATDQKNSYQVQHLRHKSILRTKGAMSLISATDQKNTYQVQLLLSKINPLTKTLRAGHAGLLPLALASRISSLAKILSQDLQSRISRHHVPGPQDQVLRKSPPDQVS